jgi:cleavage and polyadenylation specificity factor subunit 1
MAILEWSSEISDLVPVSLHSYERLPTIAPILGDGAPGLPLLRSDPASRCAALLLPAAINTSALSTLAVLPLTRDSLDDIVTGAGDEDLTDLHYSPSYTLDLAAVVDEKIARIQDFCFLPGFTEPTLAVLFQSVPKETWTGRLENNRDTFGLIVLTLASSTPTVILDCPHPLPYSCSRIFPCPPALGGVLLLTADAVIHLDQSAKITGCAANGWHKRSSALPLDSSDTPAIALEGAHVTFPSPSLALLFLRTGDVHSLALDRDGRSLASLRISSQPIVRTVAPSSLELVGREFLFVASAVGDSVLLRYQLIGGAGGAPTGAEGEDAMDVDADAFDTGSSGPLCIPACIDTHGSFSSVRRVVGRHGQGYRHRSHRRRLPAGIRVHQEHGPRRG